jgi:hypothetical protein
LLFSGCDKQDINDSIDNNELNDTNSIDTVNYKQISIGYYDDNYHHISFDNYDFTLAKGSCGYSNGLDSIDMDADNDYDIFIDGHMCDYSIFFDNCCPPPMDCIPDGSEFKIILDKDYEVAVTKDSICCTVVFNFIDTLIAGDYIDTSLCFIQNNNWTFFWSDMLPSEVTRGNWYRLGDYRYIGIRKHIGSEYKYGWIKAIITEDHIFKLSEYAFEK